MSNERAAVAILALAVVAGTGASARADADEACAHRTSGENIVDVTFAGTGDSILELEGAVRDLLGDLPVAVCPMRVDAIDPMQVIQRPADPPPALVRIWLTSSDGGATVFVVDRNWNRILVRHVDLDGGLDLVAVEELAQITYSTVDALLAGATIGVSKPAPEPEPELIEAPAATPWQPGRTLEVQLRYGSRMAGRGVPFHHELALATSVAGRGDGVVPAVSVVVGYRLPATHETSVIDIHTSGAQLRLEGALHVPLGTRTSLRPSIGVGLEAVFVDPRAVVGSDVVPEPASVTLRPLATAGVAVQRRLFGRVSVVAAVSADVDLLGSRFSIDEGTGDRTAVAEPWNIQPGLWIAAAGEL